METLKFSGPITGRPEHFNETRKEEMKNSLKKKEELG